MIALYLQWDDPLLVRLTSAADEARLYHVPKLALVH